MGLYERLLQEAAELPENPNRERNERISAYLKSRKKPVPEGGSYVTSVEFRQERERYLTTIRSLHTLLIDGGPSGMAGGYWLGNLKRKYPAEYAHLRDIREGYSYFCNVK